MSETAVVVHQGVDAQLFMPTMGIEQAVERYGQFSHFCTQILREGLDYGKIPGTDKPTLLKPGAEKLCSFFGLCPRYSELTVAEQWDAAEPFFYYKIKCQLEKHGTIIGEGIGSCNSREKKYRYRWVAENEIPPPLTPDDLQARDGSIREPKFAIDKAETTGKYGKPAEYWERFRQAIANGEAVLVEMPKRDGGKMDAYEIPSTLYRVPNPEICDVVNTLQKMAQKRAYIAATLSATGASEFFTQDMEDFADSYPATPAPPPSEPPARAATHPPAGNGKQGEKKDSSFKVMIEKFASLHGDLQVLGGMKNGDRIYFEMLGRYGCEHSNQFRSLNEAKQCYKDLLVVKRTWEQKPPRRDDEEKQPEDGSEFHASEDDLPEGLFPQ